MARKSRKNADKEISNEALIKSDVYNTALYIRLSVEDNKKRGNSVESQKSILDNYVALNDGFKIHEIYLDNGATGVNFERPAFNKMIMDIENGTINCVIVKDLSRLGRNVIDTGYYIEKYFPLNNVRFIAVNDNYDSNDSNSVGIMLPIKNMLNEAYSVDIGKKIKAQQEQSMKAGDYIGGRAPYGYKKDTNNCHKLIIDENTSWVVKQIFEWTYEKMSYNQIIKRLNEQNIMTPSLYAQSVGIISHKNLLGSGKWQTRTLHSILSNELYTGDMVQGKSKSINRKQIKQPKEKWITVKNTHEPIVSKELFEAVNQYRNEIAEKSKSLNSIPYTPNIFKGKVFCGHCGLNLHRTRSHQTVYIFRCLANDRIAKDTCRPVKIKETELISIVSDKISSNYTAFKINSPILDNQLSQLQSEIKVTKQKLQNSRNFLRSLYENLVSGIITKEEYLDMKSDYEEQISTLSEEFIEMERIEKELKTQVACYKESSNNESSDFLTREVIEKLIDKVFVYEDKPIEIVFRYQSEVGKMGVISYD